MWNPHPSKILHDTFPTASRKKKQNHLLPNWSILVSVLQYCIQCSRAHQCSFLLLIHLLYFTWSPFSISQLRCTSSMFSLLTLLCSGISESGCNSCIQQVASGTYWMAICASLRNCAPPLNKAINELTIIHEQAWMHRLQKVSQICLKTSWIEVQIK